MTLGNFQEHALTSESGEPLPGRPGNSARLATVLVFRLGWATVSPDGRPGGGAMSATQLLWPRHSSQSECRVFVDFLAGNNADLLLFYKFYGQPAAMRPAGQAKEQLFVW